jgi:hypothetical protein
MFSLGGRLERPLPPVLVNANHYSIELQWENIRIQDQNRPENKRLFDEFGSARSGSLIYLHRREKRIGSLWENVYTYDKPIILFILFILQLRGSAMSYKVENLKANTQYEFRIQYKSGSGERSDWSPILQAETTPEPMTSETVFKAINVPGTDQLEKLLQILYVSKFIEKK